VVLVVDQLRMLGVLLAILLLAVLVETEQTTLFFLI
jgi:hypothetical protein